MIKVITLFFLFLFKKTLALGVEAVSQSVCALQTYMKWKKNYYHTKCYLVNLQHLSSVESGVATAIHAVKRTGKYFFFHISDIHSLDSIFFITNLT